MGLSGSGKSTLVRCLLRLIDPTSGEVVIDGEDITKMSDKELEAFRRAKIAMVFQHYGLLPHRNVLDNASWGLEVQGVAKEERYERTRQALATGGPGRLGRLLPPSTIRRNAAAGGPGPSVGSGHRHPAYG